MELHPIIFSSSYELLWMTILTSVLRGTNALTPEPDIVFTDPVDTNRSTVSYKPLCGIDSLLNYLEKVVTNGDTLGKKYSIALLMFPSSLMNMGRLIQLMSEYDIAHVQFMKELHTN